MVNANLTGTVLERDGSVYQIATPEGTVRAVLRGKAKSDGPKVVVGDIVSLEIGEAGGLYGITAVEPRRSLLARRVPEGRGLRPVVANVDQVVVVTATVDPAPVPQLLDRLLAIAEVNHLSAAVAINKIDLAEADLDRVKQQLSKEGLMVEDWGGDIVSINISAKEKTNLDEASDWR